MLVLILGLVLFLGFHSVRIFAPGWRDGMVARLGAGPWRGLYSLVSIVGVVLIVWGYGLSRQDPIVVYDPPMALRHLTMLLVLIAFICFAVSLMPAGKLKPKLKHPMLAAVKIWAFGHLLVNGDLASILLFGSFLAWAVVDRISLKRRPGVVIPAPGPVRNDLIAAAVGVVAYLLFVWQLHTLLIGVPVM
ncbi:NnrU family protein [Methylobrevis pamukkalensis]|uniref:NnrU protein n=1 Tax=Methylobrevis pamukkalensis TaxID=1439726 RepID=A0A1E3H5Y9_9HYPH|nr:NnrU family protein [Methylobrevis pamukkalensis]ODN71749.1 NnrU protein [Methylobrevis pamukkalensis]